MYSSIVCSSFFQSVCVLGYCVLPLAAALLVCQLILLAHQSTVLFIIRCIVVLFAFGWSTFGRLDFKTFLLMWIKWSCNSAVMNCRYWYACNYRNSGYWCGCFVTQHSILNQDLLNQDSSSILPVKEGLAVDCVFATQVDLCCHRIEALSNSVKYLYTL